MSGVYMIRCTVNGRYYIGGTSLPFSQRFDLHRQDLRRRKGPRLLQACHDLYGLDALEFVPLQEFPPEEVPTREREAIEELKPDLNIYGVRPKHGAVGTFFDRNVLYDVGGRSLTIAQIASEAGVVEKAIEARIVKGLTGTALLAGKHKAPRKPYARRA